MLSQFIAHHSSRSFCVRVLSLSVGPRTRPSLRWWWWVEQEDQRCSSQQQQRPALRVRHPSSSGNDDTSSYAEVYTTTNAKTTKTKKKTRNTNAHNNTSTTLTIGLVLLALTAMRVFWSHRNAHDREGHPSSAKFQPPVGFPSEETLLLLMMMVVRHNTNSHRKSLVVARTNNAPRGSRSNIATVAANLVVDHLGRALAPMISKYEI